MRFILLMTSAAIAFATASGCAALSSWDGFSGGDPKGPDATPPDPDGGGGAVPGAADAATAAIGMVQAKSFSVEKSLAKVEVSLDRPTLAGDLIVVAVGWYDVTTNVTGVTDDHGNVYTLAVGPTLLPGEKPSTQSIYFAAGVAAAAENVVTIRWNEGAEWPDVRVAEYSGLDPRTPLDVTAALKGNDSSPTSGKVTTRFARELLVGAAITEGSFNTAGAGFTVRILSDETNLIEDRVVDAIGSYSADAPLSPGKEWIMQLATFH